MINNEEISRQTFVVIINIGKKAVKAVIRILNNKIKELAKRSKEKKLLPQKGKQSLNELMKHNQPLQNCEISGEYLKSFERTANRYNIDFALKRDPVDKSKYLFFFKARDAYVLQTAFKEFFNKNVRSKESIKTQLEKAQEQAADINKNLQKTVQRGAEIAR